MPLKGKKALVTSGPTWEPIDPVRFIANRSSGKQGHAIALALSRLGAATTLITGPTNLPNPPGIRVIKIETATEMLEACMDSLPVNIAICAAAVADWRVLKDSEQKLKKQVNDANMTIELTQNPDILKMLSSAGSRRPNLVVGFAAETENLVENATNKLKHKGCDWIIANDVSYHTGTFGGESNSVHLITDSHSEEWPSMLKDHVATRLADRIAEEILL
jgi:phosphopantothenoylcysteine decarboxylase/phosphopantothenate--cysteine ligase